MNVISIVLVPLVREYATHASTIRAGKIAASVYEDTFIALTQETAAHHVTVMAMDGKMLDGATLRPVNVYARTTRKEHGVRCALKDSMVMQGWKYIVIYIISDVNVM